MTIAELDARAQALRAKGLTYKEIGEQMGESARKAWMRCNRGREREKVRAWKSENREQLREYDHRYGRENRGTCLSCGGPMGINCPEDGTCATCRHAEYDRKARTVVALWAAGASLKAIQAEMGWTRGMVAGMFHLYREDGYDLPYRYRQGTRNATRFPDQRKVAA